MRAVHAVDGVEVVVIVVPSVCQFLLHVDLAPLQNGLRTVNVMSMSMMTNSVPR